MYIFIFEVPKLWTFNLFKQLLLHHWKVILYSLMTLINSFIRVKYIAFRKKLAQTKSPCRFAPTTHPLSFHKLSLEKLNQWKEKRSHQLLFKIFKIDERIFQTGDHQNYFVNMDKSRMLRPLQKLYLMADFISISHVWWWLSPLATMKTNIDTNWTCKHMRTVILKLRLFEFHFKAKSHPN